MEKAYLETTVISYVAARPSRDLVVAANQQISREWWEKRRSAFGLFISEPVVREAAAGDPDAAARRGELILGLQLLDVSEQAVGLAEALVRGGAVPRGSSSDALHIAIAAAHGMNYVLTWNMAHILNAQRRPLIEGVCRAEGTEPPVLCTPAELMGDTTDVA